MLKCHSKALNSSWQIFYLSEITKTEPYQHKNIAAKIPIVITKVKFWEIEA